MHPAVRFTYLGFQLTHLLDEGHQLDLFETQQHIRQGDLFDWLAGAVPFPDLDLGLYGEDDQRAALEVFDSLEDAYGGGKFGITRNGLALLLAYCLEGVQREVRT
jgi:hypothetical protein